MPFGLWIQTGPKKHVLHGAAHWRHLVNVTEPFVCRGDVAFLSNDCYYYCITITLTMTLQANVCTTVQKVTGTSLDGILLSSLELAINFINPAAPGGLNPGHGITNRPLILYGRGKEADTPGEAAVPSTGCDMTNRPAERNRSFIHQNSIPESTYTTDTY